jgi:hypothetical protein
VPASANISVERGTSRPAGTCARRRNGNAEITDGLCSGSLTAAGAASAAEYDGVVDSYSNANRTVTMDDGTVYAVAPDLNMDKLSIGDRFALTYETVDGKKVVSWFEEVQTHKGGASGGSEDR